MIMDTQIKWKARTNTAVELEVFNDFGYLLKVNHYSRLEFTIF